MKTPVNSPEVILETVVSRLVMANTRKQAAQAAASELNPSNLKLERITLENAQGHLKEFKVRAIEQLDWYDATHTEYSHRYRVYGRIRLCLHSVEGPVFPANEHDILGYTIPRPIIDEKPVLTLSSGGRNHVFLTVLQQRMELKPVAEESEDLFQPA